MSVRSTKSWLTWLLPLLILRAFVPAGFMLSWAGNELQVVLCAGTGAAIPVGTIDEQSADSSAHLHAEHHAHEAQSALDASHEHNATQHDHSGAQTHEGSYCPFAVTGTAVAAITLQPFAAEPPSSATFDAIADPALRSASVLIDRIRGPPLV